MAARAMWKGRIRFGGIDVPVKLYSALEGTGIGFRLLHDTDKRPVEQRMIDPETGDIVEYADIKRAFETEDGNLVILEDEELEELVPKESRDIEITRFVGEGAITHEWYDRPYYLGPDGNEAEYFALVTALQKKKKTGLARWVMRKKDYVGALRVEGDYLMLMTLLRSGEVVPADQLPSPAGRDLDKREIAMAKQLVAALEDELDMTAYRDEYSDRVMELIEAKQKGKVLSFPKAPRRKKETSLADMLEKSLTTTKKKKAAHG
jgi:DNA end-binding protein Ku